MGTALLLGLAACAGQPKADAGPAPFSATSLVVDNQNTQVFEVYLQSASGLKVRLGSAPGNRTSEFRIPEDLIASGGSVRFLALPIASRDVPQTQELVLRRGDRIGIRITPR